jgi:hypothetical protein
MRLTFRAANGEIQLISVEHLDMICPPSVAERPIVGKNGGYWMELRDKADRVLFHRLLHSPLANSVEVHSPDGKIERIFGEPKENVFEVLVPDDANASAIVMLGETLEPSKVQEAKQAPSRELARFNLSEGDTGKQTKRGRGGK